MKIIDTPDWVYSKRPPERDLVNGDRLYHVEPGCEYGGKDEDGVLWYRIQCTYWFGDWIEEQDQTMWRIHGGYHRGIYIVREDLFAFIKLKWL
mgnify:CR=1 FL=1